MSSQPPHSSVGRLGPRSRCTVTEGAVRSTVAPARPGAPAIRRALAAGDRRQLYAGSRLRRRRPRPPTPRRRSSPARARRRFALRADRFGPSATPVDTAQAISPSRTPGTSRDAPSVQTRLRDTAALAIVERRVGGNHNQPRAAERRRPAITAAASRPVVVPPRRKSSRRPRFSIASAPTT